MVLRKISNNLLFLTTVVLCIALTSIPLQVHASDVEDLDDAPPVAEVTVEETIIEADVAEPEAIVETEDTAPEEVIEQAISEEESEKETAEKKIAEEAAEFIAAAEISAHEEAAALKKSVTSRIAGVTKKLKSSALTKQNVKKTIALGAGVWGAATGVGWAMQNYGAGALKE